MLLKFFIIVKLLICNVFYSQVDWGSVCGVFSHEFFSSFWRVAGGCWIGKVLLSENKI